MKPTESALPSIVAPEYEPSQMLSSKLKHQARTKKRFTPSLSSKKMKIAGKFDPAVAHELRNPLTTINLSIEMLKSEVNEPHLNIYLDVIMRSSMRVNNLIDEVLKHKQEIKS